MRSIKFRWFWQSIRSAEGRKDYDLQQLEGIHLEKGVLVITGTKYTVKHWDREHQEMYFVFDKARDDEYLKTLFDHFKIKFPKLQLKKFRQLSDEQLHNNSFSNFACGPLDFIFVNVQNREYVTFSRFNTWTYQPYSYLPLKSRRKI